MSTKEMDVDIREEALTVLDEMTRWKLGTQEWENVSSILDRFEKALLESNDQALRDAVIELELASPFRVPPISRPEPDENAERQLRERADRLVHKISNLNRRDRGDDQVRDHRGR